MELVLQVVDAGACPVLTFVDFSECAASESLDYLVATLEYLSAVVYELIVKHCSYTNCLWMVAI